MRSRLCTKKRLWRTHHASWACHIASTSLHSPLPLASSPPCSISRYVGSRATSTDRKHAAREHVFQLRLFPSFCFNSLACSRRSSWSRQVKTSTLPMTGRGDRDKSWDAATYKSACPYVPDEARESEKEAGGAKRRGRTGPK